MSQRTRPDGVHRSWLEVDLDGPRDVLVVAGLGEVDGGPNELLGVLADVLAAVVEPVLHEQLLPEGGSKLVTGLSDLEVD